VNVLFFSNRKVAKNAKRFFLGILCASAVKKNFP